MGKKPYSWYKERYRVPFIAWLFDKPPVLIVSLLACSLVLSGVLYQGYGSVKSIFAKPVKENPYALVQPTKTPGVEWATNFIKGFKIPHWKISDNTVPRLPSGVFACEVAEHASKTLVATTMGENDEAKLYAHVYGAGQARKAYDAYREKLRDCEGSAVKAITNDKGVSVVEYSHGRTMLTAGDTVVFAKNMPVKDLISHLEKTLQDSACHSLNNSPQDIHRSFYYNKEQYQGFSETKQILPEVNMDHIPKMVEVKPEKISYPGLEEPEAPLPEKFPKLPKRVRKPASISVPGMKTPEDLSVDATYKIMDVPGPGCGWTWSGQKAPVYDTKKLAQDKKQSIRDAQEATNTQAKDYVFNHVYSSIDLTLGAVEVNEWNMYVKNVNDVHKKWRELILARKKFYPQWEQYLQEYEDWDGFDDRKQRAQDLYDKQVQKCEDARKELEDWENNYGNIEEAGPAEDNMFPSDDGTLPPEDGAIGSTPTPEPSIPPRPAGCDTDPVRPPILDQEKPAKPTAPTPPEGVTIPNSWEKPE